MVDLEVIAWSLVFLLATALAISWWRYHQLLSLLPRPTVPSVRKPIKILIVEDDPVSRAILLRVCARLGYTVVSDVADGLVAWRVLQEDPTINVLITDLQIPGIDGVELISLVESLPRKVYIVIVSGASDLIQVTEKHMFLEKPVSFIRLLEIFKQIDV